MQTSFRLLGPVSVLQGDQVLDIGGPTARAVMAVLLLRGPAGVTIDGLRDAVWGAEGASRESVYHYVSGLRSALAAADADAVVESCRPGYRMAVADDAIDWNHFKRLVAQARRGRDRGDRDEAAELLTTARQLWCGSPLTGIGERLAGPRRKMWEAYLMATEELASMEAARGRPYQVVELLERSAEDHPGRERTVQLLIEALVALGRRDETGILYQRTHQYLAEHHGLGPSAALSAAYEAGLRADDPQAHRPAAKAPVRASPSDVQPADLLPAEASAGAQASPVGAELPALPRFFTGRSAELDRVIVALRPISSSTPVVCGVSGMPGVGKTTLVLHAARTLAPAYPDGCLFVDLHGYTAGSRPENPGDVLGRLLWRLGVSGENVPRHLDDRATLWRQRLDGRQLLLILDDAHDVAQARPLLAQVPGCGTLITSRTRLTALDEAELIELDTLPAVDGATLFRSVAGPRLSTEPDATANVDRIVDACGGLPLAIRVAAARFRSEPDPLIDLCARLEDQHSRLAELDDGDRSVFSALTVSYAGLPPDLQRAFALLGVHPGTDLELHAAVAMLDRPMVATRRLLTGLVDRHLLTRSGSGRYRLHDLVAAFARECLTGGSVGETRARERLVSYHLYVAELADTSITPHRYRIPLGLAYRPLAVPDVHRPDEAMRWLSAQEHVLVELCRDALGHGLYVQCWQLAYTLRGYFFLTKRWAPWVETHEAALAAARRLGDVQAEALTLNNLGLAAIDQGQSRLAQDRYQRALTLFGQVGNEHGETTARANLAWIHFGAGRYREFLGGLWPAHAFYERNGSRRNAAITLRGIALGEIEVGEFAGAVEHLEQVRQVFAELKLDLDLAMTLNALGEAYGRSGMPDVSDRSHSDALEVSLRCGSTFEAARAHYRLGDLAAAAGDRPGARRHWEVAAQGYGLLNAPQVGEVRARLARPDG